MITYVINNRNPAKDIVEKAKKMFLLEEIDTQEEIWLGNNDMMLEIGDKNTSITLFDSGTNIKNLKDYIMGK